MYSLFMWLSIISGFIASFTWFAATVINHKQERKNIEVAQQRAEKAISEIMFDPKNDFFLDKEYPDEPSAFASLRNKDRMEKIFDKYHDLVADGDLGGKRILQNRLNGAAALITGLAVLFQTFANILQN